MTSPICRATSGYCRTCISNSDGRDVGRKQVAARGSTDHPPYTLGLVSGGRCKDPPQRRCLALAILELLRASTRSNPKRTFGGDVER